MKCGPQLDKENGGDGAEGWKVVYQGWRPGMREQGAWDMEFGWGHRGGWHWGAGCWDCASEIPRNRREAQDDVKSSMHSCNGSV